MPPNKNSKRQEADLEQQLKSLLPGMGKSNTKMEVMEEAAKYIEKLQTNLIGHIRTHGYPDKLKSCSGVNNTSSGQSDDRDSIRRTVDNYVCRTMMK